MSSGFLFYQSTLQTLSSASVGSHIAELSYLLRFLPLFQLLRLYGQIPLVYTTYFLWDPQKTALLFCALVPLSAKWLQY